MNIETYIIKVKSGRLISTPKSDLLKTMTALVEGGEDIISVTKAFG